MPFKSEAQRRWMHVNHPSMAKRWEKETPKKKKLPYHKKKGSLLTLSFLNDFRKSANDGPPNYRPSGDLTRSCSACAHFKTGNCERYSVPVDPHYTCDDFQLIQLNTGPLAKLTNQIQPDKPIIAEQSLQPKLAAVKVSSEEAFKAGFLMRCLDEGLDDNQIQDRIQFGLTLEKQGVYGIPVGAIASGLGQGAIGAAIGLPIAAGALSGYTAAKATSSVDNDIDALKEQELLDTYNFLADDAERRAKLKRKQRGLPADGRIWKFVGKDQHVELPR